MRATVADVSTTGTVEWFSEHKGYGYVIADDGTALYVHHSQISGEGFRTLTPGLPVTFEPGDDGRGPTATKVRPLDDPQG